MSDRNFDWPAFFAGALAPMVLAAVVLWQSWPVMVLWNWFAVPLGAPALSLAHAAGFMCLLAAASPKSMRDDRPIAWERVLVAPFALVAIGYVAKGAM